MKIAFVTTQSLLGSTVVGRVLPLAEELVKKHEIHVLVHKGSSPILNSRFHIQYSGRDPFLRTPSGKIRHSGFRLAFTMLTNAFRSAVALIRLKPDVIIIAKPLPENVLAVWLARIFIRPKKIILDVDDFELTAQVLTSLAQRAAVHWAERTGAKLAHHIVAATPFLSDHFEQLTQEKKKITMIVTGVPEPLYRRLGVPERPDPPTLIYAGSLSLASGHRIDLLPEILAEVRKKCPETVLHVYGTGDDEELLPREGIVLHGRFNEESLRATAGVFIDPVDNSITARAKSSFRVALAAALGLPVVTSDIGIRPYLLPDELHARCFAKPTDVADYAAKIIAFLQSPLTPAAQAHLKKHAEQFTWVRLGEKYAKLVANK